MISTEAFPVAALRLADPQLRGVYGFTWNTSDPDNTVSPFAVVRGEVETDRGEHRSIVLRAGQRYGSASRIQRAWFTCAAPGVLSLDVAYEQGDELVPTPPPSPTTGVIASQVTIPTGTNLNPGVPFVSWTKPSPLYNRLQLVQAAGGYRLALNRFRFLYSGAEVFRFDVGIVAALPAFLLDVNPQHASALATQMGLSALSGGHTQLPAPDVLTYENSHASTVLVTDNPMVLTAFWTVA